jgi:16S rRNA (guanine527-N7)-methyltransferase
LVWAIARPDLEVTLIEPLLRRTTFLSEVIDAVGLANVRVIRGRAANVSEHFEVVTARAVADLGRLAEWCLPLVRPGGVLLALKGESASAEVAMWTEAMRRDGATDIVVTSYGDVEKPTTVVEVSR